MNNFKQNEYERRIETLYKMLDQQQLKINQYENELRTKILEEGHTFHYMGYNIRDLILLAETCKQLHIQPEDLHKYNLDLQFAYEVMQKCCINAINSVIDLYRGPKV